MRGLIGRTIGLLVAGVAVAFMTAAVVAQAQTQTETIVAEQRTSLSLRVAPEAVQALLPAGWTAAAPNVSLAFMDRKLALGPDGKPLFSGVNRMLVISASAKNAQTGQTRAMIVGGYSADPAGVPGAYKVYGVGSIDLERSERIDGVKANLVDERWTVTAADGGKLDVKLSFTRGTPTLGPLDLKIYSAAEPEFYRIYRGRQATDTLRNPAAGIDRVQSVTVEASGGKLGKLLEGAQIVSVSNAPFYTRETFVP